MLKKLLQAGNTREEEEKDLQKQAPNNKENGNRNIYIDNYLKCELLKCPTKRHRLAEWIRKQDPYICCL